MRILGHPRAVLMSINRPAHIFIWSNGGEGSVPEFRDIPALFMMHRCILFLAAYVRIIMAFLTWNVPPFFSGERSGGVGGVIGVTILFYR